MSMMCIVQVSSFDLLFENCYVYDFSSLQLVHNKYRVQLDSHLRLFSRSAIEMMLDNVLYCHQGYY